MRRKVWYKRMWIYIVGGVLLLLAAYLIVQGIRCSIAVKESKERLAAYGAETVQLSYGNMSYVDTGEGETILSVHGIFGGYDQAYDTCKDFSSDYRIIAPSRFGYLGSDILGDGTPAEQATAYVELLDKLGIDKVYLLATSAPAFLCNDFTMFLISPLFDPIMGMEPSTIYSMLPISDRKKGVILDASVTNVDMARNYDNYRIEDLQVPTLIFHAKDDKLASYTDTEKAIKRFPNCTFIPFENGGHLMTGHGEEIKEAISKFTRVQ